jgi:hypothetical protein
MIGAGQPENFFAVHPGLAREDILDGIVEDVTHMQQAGDIGRGNYN